MDALGRLLRTMMWDTVKAEDCQEMFNVSRATTKADSHSPLSALQPSEAGLSLLTGTRLAPPTQPTV